MTAGRYDIIIEQGATFTRTLTWSLGGSPANLTGYTARMMIRRSYEEDAIVTMTTENGGITLGGIAGTISLLISAAATANLPRGSAVYDLEMITSSGTVYRLLQGKVRILREVTR